MKELQLKKRYKNQIGGLNIGQQLIQPCLAKSILYRRGTGYFTSSALKTYAEALDIVIKNNTKIEILCSPKISDKLLISTLEKFTNDKDKANVFIEASKDILLAAVEFKADKENRSYRAILLSYLIMNKSLEIKIAIPKDYNPMSDSNEGMYHVKNGYFVSHAGDKVAFEGSFNESESGHIKNRESAQVFVSWREEDDDRLKELVDDIDDEWNGNSNDIEVYDIDRETLEKIVNIAPDTPPKPSPPPPPPPPPPPSRKIWEHKKEAIKKFLEKKRGILEMATGTGKTQTALEIAKQLVEAGKVNSIIIETHGIPLLKQWNEEIINWKDDSNSTSVSNLNIFLEFEAHRDLARYLNLIEGSVLLISREAINLKKLLFSNNVREKANKILIIHDEAHGFGSNSMVEHLQGSHEPFIYTLGLTATPERDYDDGNDFIENEIGPVIFKFKIEDAIRKGILCEFNYFPLSFQLTSEDKKKRNKVIRAYHAAANAGNAWPKEQFYIRLAAIQKNAQNKPMILDEFIKQNQEKLVSTIFFVDNKAQGTQITSVVKNYTYNFGTFYQKTSNQVIDYLSSNRLHSVIACTRLNEGIDIPSLENIFLVSSSRAKLTTIQRIGRCLRIDKKNPLKVANIVDLVLDEDLDEDGEIVNSDQERKEWITELSKIKKEKIDG